MAEPTDLPSLDARVQAAAKEVDRVALTTEDDRALARRFPPFQGKHREIAGQTTYQAIRDYKAQPHETLHRDALLRWVYELLQTRVGWELRVDLADAAQQVDPALSNPNAKEKTITVAKTYVDAHRALIEAPHPSAAATALLRLDELALPVLAVKNELRARRNEAARRLGVDDDATADSGSRLSSSVAIAQAFLDQTELLAGEIHRSSRAKNELGLGDGTASAAFAIWDSFGRDAQEGWPAHLNARWFEDVFKALIVGDRVPRWARREDAVPPIGAATFQRAAASWGHALRLGATARSLPFALSRDPQPTEAIAFGYALAITIGERVFAKRKLGLATRSADAHARVLGRVLFHELRRQAANIVVPTISGDSQAVLELSRRVFGAPLPSTLASIWSHGGGLAAKTATAAAPSASPSTSPSLIAILRAHDLLGSLVERFDDDWFDNPRSGTHLASIGAGPVVTDTELQASLLAEGDKRATQIVRAFEERLG